MKPVFLIRSCYSLLLIFLGGSGSLFLTSFFYKTPIFFFNYHYWATAVIFLVILLCLLQAYLRKYREQECQALQETALQEQEQSLATTSDLRTDLEQFKREVIYVAREAVKTYAMFSLGQGVDAAYEEKKRHFFREFRKEFSEVRWMSEVIEDVKKLLKDPPPKRSQDPSDSHKTTK